MVRKQKPTVKEKPAVASAAKPDDSKGAKMKSSTVVLFICVGLLTFGELHLAFNLFSTGHLKAVTEEELLLASSVMSLGSGYMKSSGAQAGANTTAKTAVQSAVTTPHAYAEDGHYRAQGVDMLREPHVMLNDRTIELSPHVFRPWLYFDTDVYPEPPEGVKKPRRKLVLTDLAWNNPNQTLALSKFPRGLRSREFLQAFIDHPDFDPNFSWTSMLKGKENVDTTIEYVVLFDIETCFEANYPNNVAQFKYNTDRQGGRLVDARGQHPCYYIDACGKRINTVILSPLFRKVKKSTLLYLDCRGDGPLKYRHDFLSTQLAIVSIDGGPGQMLEEADIGMPPPAVNPVILPYPMRQMIQNGCETESTLYRPFFFTFVGSGNRGKGNPRQNLFDMHNGKDVILMRRDDFKKIEIELDENFRSLMQKSVFSAAPRGDNHFSYRFTEVLSAGAIPVVHSDGWFLPFNKKLFDWNKCAVLIPEVKFNQTLDILRQIPKEKRCEMRKFCFEIYHKYFVNAEANMAGILDTLDALHAVNTTAAKS